MADGTKHKLPINGGMITDLKSIFPVFKTRKTLAFAYGFMFAFVGFTIFLAFNPSSYNENSYFTNIFTTKTGSVESNRSQFSSIFTFFFNNTTSPENLASFLPPPPKNTTAAVRSQNTTVQLHNTTLQQLGTQNLSKVPIFIPPTQKTEDSVFPPPSENTTAAVRSQNTTVQSHNTTLQQLGTQNLSKVPIFIPPPTQKTEDSVLSGVLKPNHTAAPAIKPPPAVNRSGDSNSVNLVKGSQLKGQENANYTASFAKNHGSSPIDDESLVKSLMNCDLFDGNWVKDESYPLYKPGSCSLIDEQFNCINNGRPDKDYHKFKWKPKACTLPRLNGGHLLNMLKGKRLVFVGDSLNRNMWESLVCILKSAVKDQSKVYEAQGRHHFRGEASYSFIFKDYNCTVEFFVSPFLVQEWEMPEKGGKTKETLRLDLVGRSSDQYKSADIIIFNTGHWWTHDKTAKGKDYYQEGSHVYGELNVLEAFRKALTTWARWVDANVHPEKSWVFFRGYSASHFSGGQWNSGGACDNETMPIDNDKYLTPYPPKMLVLEKVFQGMKTHISYLNVTRLTDYRKDGHPSIYRKKHIPEKERSKPLLYQDCSHWCLPGVPDAWNEILYAELLIKQYEKLHRGGKMNP